MGETLKTVKPGEPPPPFSPLRAMADRSAGHPGRHVQHACPPKSLGDKGRFADATKAMVKRPVAVYIEKVYEEGDFTSLGIGT